MKLFGTVLLISGLAMANSASAADGMSWSGFMDTQYQYKKEGIDPGFVLNDAALYVNAEFGKAKMMLDLPFSGQTGEASSFKFGKGKAQAFLTLSLGNGLNFSMGQFDTPYGFEGVDSKGLTFTTAGILGGQFLPVTHMGGMLAYSHNEFTLKAFVGNTNNQTTLSTYTSTTDTAPTTENPDMGGQLSFANDMMRASAGWVHHQQRGPTGAMNLFSFTAGTNFEPFTIDAEFDMKKIADGDWGWGLLGNVVASATDALSAAARFEVVKKVPSGGNHEQMQFTFGPQYAWSKNVKLKADYSWTGTKATAGASRTTEHSVNGAAVFMF